MTSEVTDTMKDEAIIQVKGPNGSTYTIGGSNDCFVIAEIGQNHQGNLDIAMHLIRESALAGANCVKFQLSSLEDRFTRSSLDREYNSLHSFGKTYRDHRLALSLTRDQLSKCSEYARQQGVLFSASATDISSIDFLVQQLNIPFLKIGSGDVNNLPLIQYTAKTYPTLPLIISTGMVNDVSVIDNIYSTILRIREEQLKTLPSFALLHCISSYPTDDSSVNLCLIPQFKCRYSKAVIGYSGHEVGTEISLSAVTLGAKILERHVTFDLNAQGSDHQCSLLPSQLKQLIDGISRVHRAIGSLNINHRKRFPCELSCYYKLGRFVVAQTDLTDGSMISSENITLKVVDTHKYPVDQLIPGEEFDSCVGRKVNTFILNDTPVLMNQLERLTE